MRRQHKNPCEYWILQVLRRFLRRFSQRIGFHITRAAVNPCIGRKIVKDIYLFGAKIKQISRAIIGIIERKRKRIRTRRRSRISASGVHSDIFCFYRPGRNGSACLVLKIDFFDVLSSIDLPGDFYASYGKTSHVA